MRRKTPLILAVLFGALYLLPALVLRDADFILFIGLPLLRLPILIVQMLGWTLFGPVGQIILTTLLLSLFGWVIGLAIRKFVFR